MDVLKAQILSTPKQLVPSGTRLAWLYYHEFIATLYSPLVTPNLKPKCQNGFLSYDDGIGVYNLRSQNLR